MVCNNVYDTKQRHLDKPFNWKTKPDARLSDVVA